MSEETGSSAIAKRRFLRLRQLAQLLPGTRERRRQIVAYAEAWQRANTDAMGGSGPLWVVLGDSTAQAVGASGPDRGYVGDVVAWLNNRDGAAWRIVNLSRSGATSADLIGEQLPALAEHPTPDLVSCAIGANDLLHRADALETNLGTIAAALPAGSLLANLPQGLRERRAARANRVVAQLVREHGHQLVDLWSVTGPPWRGKYSGDWFHPNDRGYQDWAGAFVAALDQGS